MYVSPVHLGIASKILNQGGVIAYPTEAVWGLGCDPWNCDAVFKLLMLKQRPWEKGLIMVASDMKQLDPLLGNLNHAQLSKLEMSWPGPVSWVLPDDNNWVPKWSRGEHESVAVRVSSHPLVHKLCARLGRPIISTSANLAGEAPARTKNGLSSSITHYLDYIVPGQTLGQDQPSVIRDLMTDQVFRA